MQRATRPVIINNTMGYIAWWVIRGTLNMSSWDLGGFVVVGPILTYRCEDARQRLTGGLSRFLSRPRRARATAPVSASGRGRALLAHFFTLLRRRLPRLLCAVCLFVCLFFLQLPFQRNNLVSDRWTVLLLQAFSVASLHSSRQILQNFGCFLLSFGTCILHQLVFEPF